MEFPAPPHTKPFRETSQYPRPTTEFQESSVKEIVAAAGWQLDATFHQLRQLAPAAGAHFKRGASAPEAWARASSDFPEYQDARAIISLFLGLTEATTELERTLKQVPMQERSDRASLLGTTLENLILASQAPQQGQMCTHVQNAVGEMVVKPLTDYLPRMVQAYAAKYGAARVARRARKTRRDAGVAKDPATLKAQRQARGAPQPEAAPCQTT